MVAKSFLIFMTILNTKLHQEAFRVFLLGIVRNTKGIDVSIHQLPVFLLLVMLASMKRFSIQWFIR